jgi:hypothetical protein
MSSALDIIKLAIDKSNGSDNIIYVNMIDEAKMNDITRVIKILLNEHVVMIYFYDNDNSNYIQSTKN